mgnify:CR=1 FL=1
MFEELLKRAGLTKAELARRLGLTANAISRWRNNPPRYAVAYLEQMIEFNRIKP